MNDNIKKAIYALQNSDAIERYGGVEKLRDDLLYIFQTFPKIIDLMNDMRAVPSDEQEAGRNIDYMYSMTRLIVLMTNFASDATPICRRYFPTEEDKAKMAEFIKQLKEVENDDSESETRDK